ncbi:hypothetical protein A3197_05555 [Candidatus Thiodiazotropha endoloripes]|nr:hypothetical protein A3197_05555 [Candidatus Thiodiazotropha endoloripes]
MPNCDFYAVGGDLQKVLEFVFEELGCRVFELSSKPDTELREFRSAEEVMTLGGFGECIGNAHSVYLQLWAQSASGEVEIRKISLNPKACNGATFRYQIQGWGLIQLYLGGISKAGIIHSHTNHNSEKRAEKWASTYDELGAVSSWDWKVVNQVSSKLNRYIRKISVLKLNSRPVLPEAGRDLEAGKNAL